MSSKVGLVLLPAMEVEGVVFSPTVAFPTSSKELILAGAGVRGMMIEGKFVKFTTSGFYIEEAIVAHLLLRWKQRTAEELGNTLDFYMDLVTCPYEKLVRVAFILPLTGIEFCLKVSEHCRIACEAAGMYSEAEAKAIEQLKDIFKDKNFLPGYSTLFSISPAGLGIAFSKDGWSVPEKDAAIVIENRALAEGFLATVIGENGVTPAAKAAIADRVSKLLNEY